MYSSWACVEMMSPMVDESIAWYKYYIGIPAGILLLLMHVVHL